MKSIFSIFFSISLTLVFITSCEHEEILPKNNNQLATEDSVYLFVNELMHYWYYWDEQVPAVDYLNYDNPQSLMDALKVPQDKWSFIDKYQSLSQYFAEGEEYGYGFYLGWDNQYNLKVFLCYQNSPAYNQGVRRGWTVEAINGKSVNLILNFNKYFDENPLTTEFSFLDENGYSKIIELDKAQYNLSSILNSSTFPVAGKKVGYMAYQSFLGYSEDDLKSAVKDFQAEQINELIVDLRYNTGGYNTIAEYLSEVLCPADKFGSVLYTLKHNKNRSALNDTTIYLNSNADNLNLSRVFFLTNEYSASASELVINSLSPHMEVYQIGDTTSGKPYSMYGFLFQDWLAYPVCAKTVNANGSANYDNGLIPDKYVVDNFSYDWGDVNDPLIKQAINFIEYGAFGDVALKSAKVTGIQKIIDPAEKFSRSLQIIMK